MMTDLTADEIDDLRDVLKAITDDSHHAAIDKLCDMAQILEIVREQHLRDASLAAQKAADYSWIVDPDRMGGQFTQEEIDRATRGGEGW